MENSFHVAFRTDEADCRQFFYQFEKNGLSNSSIDTIQKAF